MRRIKITWLLLAVCGSLLIHPPSGSRAINFIVSSSPARLQEDIVINFGQTKRGAVPAPGPGGCSLDPTQYVFDIEEDDCEPVSFGLNVFLTSLNNQDIHLYARIGRRVAIEDGKVVADYFPPPTGRGRSLSIDFLSSPPLQPGRYYFAVTNCGPESADYDLFFGGSFIDFFSPFALITRVDIRGDELLMYGCYPKKPAKLFLNGELKGNTERDERRPRGLIISKEADKIAPGETVKLQLRFRNGIVSNKFKFTRPIE